MRIQGVVMYETDWVKARNTTISMHESWIDEVTCHCMIYIQDERYHASVQDTWTGERRRDEKQKTLLLLLLIHYNWQHITLECRKHPWHRHHIGHGRHAEWASLIGTIKGINKLIYFIKQWTLTLEVKVIGRLEMKMLKHFDWLWYLLQYAFLNM